MTLSEWASLAEIIGVILVIVSLIFVAVSIRHNNELMSAENDSAMFDALREISLVVIQDAELSAIIERGTTQPEELSTIDERRYLYWVSLNIDIWVRVIRRQQKGLIKSDQAINWHEYYEDFTKRNITAGQWNKLKWEWGSHEIVKRIDALVEEQKND